MSPLEITGGPRAIAREIRRAKKPELQRIGLHWHRHMLPDHFVESARGRYKTQPRSTKWKKRKRALTGQDIDNVFTGRMRDEVTRSARVTSTSKGARVALRGPRWLYVGRKNGRDPNKAAEITRTTKKEEQELAELFDRRLTRRLNSVRTVERMG